MIVSPCQIRRGDLRVRPIGVAFQYRAHLVEGDLAHMALR